MDCLGDDDHITLTINGKVYQAGHALPIDTSLNTFIRENALLPGTKYMCKEGGCGACVVAIKKTHPVTKKERVFAVNSCLLPVLACHGAAITTIEGLGSRGSGYHDIQSTLARCNGSQCGYCSPGMVMNMYSLLKSNPGASQAEIEEGFGGNICRCTGYRPILDAFKSLSTNTTIYEEIPSDIEDMPSCPALSTTSEPCEGCPLSISEDDEFGFEYLELAFAPPKIAIRAPSSDAVWFRVATVEEIFEVFDMIGKRKYMLLGGNTGRGVYRMSPVSVYIDINDVISLRSHSILPDRVELGAAIPLNELIPLFYGVSRENPLLFGYTQQLAKHLQLVANIPVRNIATIGGNLTLKHDHRDFQSDIFVIFETIHAFVCVEDQRRLERRYPLSEYLDVNMNKKLISKVVIPALSSQHYEFKTFKIMPRAQNSPASLNAGFLFRVDRIPGAIVVAEKPSIVYGNISPKFVRAVQLENYLRGKNLMDANTLRTAMDVLANELKPDISPPKFSPEYRKLLALSLFYRMVLYLGGDAIGGRLRSGAFNLKRHLSSGKQDYATNPNNWPLNQPMPKLDGLLQTSGEAEYINDMPAAPHELYGALVTATEATAKIDSINATEALKVKGVVAFYSAKDIPGQNTIGPRSIFILEQEELFCSGRVLYSGQPVGIIVAESQELAIEAAKLVKIKYSGKRKPLLTVDDVLQAGDEKRISLQANIEPTRTGGNVKYKIKGEYKSSPQYHYTMELQTCRVVPVEDQLIVYPSTQWVNHTLGAISQVLKIPEHNIDIQVRRVGGAYGAKTTRSVYVAAPCALAAYKLNRPVRMVLSMETNTQALGKRNTIDMKYEVGVDDNGQIQYLNADVYTNVGASLNEPTFFLQQAALRSGYDASTFNIRLYDVRTDIPGSNYARAPGTSESIASIEYIMDHIAEIVGKDPVAVRLSNMTDQTMIDMVNEWRLSTEYDTRLQEINKFNSDNRWKKRGIYMVPQRYPIEYFLRFHSMVTIYEGDGSVAITHGGIEIGQGINTKIAQVAASTLKIGLGFIKIKPSTNLTSPNDGPTGGSITTDGAAFATLQCCQEINRRLEETRRKLGGNPEWLQVIQQASLDGVDLNASYMWSPNEPIPKPYGVYGVTVLEVVVDVLTGQYNVKRVDILEDAGESLSPELDIGQVEGAFMMGMGMYTSEEIVYDTNSGALLTDRTWNYYPPGANDIPIDFRVTLRKNVPNPIGVLRSKATGEPPLGMSVSVLFAIKNALKSARKDAGLSSQFFNFFPPATIEKTLLNSGTTKEQLKLK